MKRFDLSGAIIPYGKQHIDNEDIQEVLTALQGDFITCGPYVDKFELSLLNETGADFATVCANGTAALHLALMALGIGDGDTVIVPTITFLATANAVRYCGANVVFADVDPQTGLITDKALEQAIQRAENKVKAVICVHLAGQLVDIKAIYSACNSRNIKIVEDACHAIGAAGVGACQYSDMVTFSFHPVKTIAMGEGGAITTNNELYHDKMQMLRSHGMVKKDHWKYDMEELGYNYRASDLQCALGYSQLKKIGKFRQKRLEIAKLYDEFFKDIDWATPVVSYDDSLSYHLYPILVEWDKIGKSREEFMDELKEKGIGTQVHYIPVHTQPYYGGDFTDFPGAKRFYEHVISLPMYYDLSKEDQKKVMEALSAYQ